jgi:hypothetical protein
MFLGPFERNTITVASTILIILLAIIGYFLATTAEGSQWPPSIANCPDYFEDTTGKGDKCLNVKNLGKCKPFPPLTKDYREFAKPENRCISSTVMTKCNLTWDGITNVDPCSGEYIKRAKENGIIVKPA